MLSTVAGLYRVPERALRHDDRLHEQPLLGLDARLRQPRVARSPSRPRWTTSPSGSASTALEIRRRNATRPGDVNPQGFVITSLRDDRVPRRGRRARSRKPVGRPPRPGWKRGVGYAGMFHVGGGARIYRSDGCGAIVKLDDFGKVTLITGASEIGQGSETVLAMIVAEDAGRPARARRGRQLRHRGQALGRRRPREPDDVHRRQRRAPGRARSCRRQLLALAAAQLDEPAERARASTTAASASSGDPQRRHGVRPRRSGPGTSARAAGSLVAEAFYDPPTEMLDKDLRGNVSADVRLRGPGGAGRGGARRRARSQVLQGRLRPRRGPGAQPAGRRGPDPRRHPHGARLLRSPRSSGSRRGAC